MNKEETQTEEKPLNWIQKKLLKKAIKKIRKAMIKGEQEDEKIRQTLTEEIWEMKEKGWITNIYLDEEQKKEITTRKELDQLDNNTLEEYLELCLKEWEKSIK